MVSTSVQATDWNKILDFYTDLIDEGLHQMPMLILVDHITETRLAERLFAYTSMQRLVISIYNPIEPLREALHIEYKPIGDLMIFKYYGRPLESSTFNREFKSDKGIKNFDLFIKLIRW